jgi:hypothetical protein
MLLGGGWSDGRGGGGRGLGGFGKRRMGDAASGGGGLNTDLGGVGWVGGVLGKGGPSNDGPGEGGALQWSFHYN